MKKITPILFILFLSGCASTPQVEVATIDPLPSWNNGQPKQQIIEFVEKVSTPGSEQFVPIEKRIATFDNDGTLWAEQPAYFQLFFILDRIKSLAPQHPEWKATQPFKAVLENDMHTVHAGGEKALLKLAMAAQAGMTVLEFERIVTDWLATARHPTTGKRYKQMVYQPMLEVLDYLRANGFKVFIVSGGGLEFMRPWSQAVYGIPPDQVVGSSSETRYEVRNGVPEIIRLPKIHFINDKETKPVAINRFIGQRPILAFGNSDGDYQMIEWATAGAGPRLGLFVHHTDSKREWAYDRESSIGRLNRGLDDAESHHWVIVDMARDWQLIYPYEMNK